MATAKKAPAKTAAKRAAPKPKAEGNPDHCTTCNGSGRTADNAGTCPSCDGTGLK